MSWVLTTLEVWSRLWISFEIGRRSFRNIKRVMLDTLQRGRVEHRFLFTTDGFEMYEWVAKRLLKGVVVQLPVDRQGANSQASQRESC